MNEAYRFVTIFFTGLFSHDRIRVDWPEQYWPPFSGLNDSMIFYYKSFRCKNRFTWDCHIDVVIFVRHFRTFVYMVTMMTILPSLHGLVADLECFDIDHENNAEKKRHHWFIRSPWGIKIRRFFPAYFSSLSKKKYVHVGIHTNISAWKYADTIQFRSSTIKVCLLLLTRMSSRESEHKVPSDQWAWFVIHEAEFVWISRQYRRVHFG